MADYIRRCEIEKEVAKSREKALDRCEFHPERYWSREKVVVGIVLAFVLGYATSEVRQ